MLSVVIPVYNEEGAIVDTLKSVDKGLSEFPEHEIIVVNDGSTDATRERIAQAGLNNLTLINHVENLGYGKSLFDGIAVAKGEYVGIIDGDGSYPAESFKELWRFCPEYDMVVGARRGNEYRRGFFKRTARAIFTFLAEYASGKKVPDVNSGQRIFRKEIVLEYRDSLCTGFSFTTTLTMIFLLNHYYVKYVPIDYRRREGKSKVRHFKDTLRAAQIIVEAFLYYNPIKLFLLLAILNSLFGVVIGLLDHFVFKTALLSLVGGICIASFAPIFCVGLLADQLKKIYGSRK
ncbi:MAG: glycosyltransferase family 2 protein [Planctomycetota bacterium]|nr:glycosyltransferase family 2 protein [Planctomycetota bacterium]